MGPKLSRVRCCGGCRCCWWLGLVQSSCACRIWRSCFRHVAYQVKNSNAARACAWCQLTSPALIFMSLCCGDGVPSSTALGASSVRVHGSSAVSLMSLYGPLYEFFRSHSRAEMPPTCARPEWFRVRVCCKAFGAGRFVFRACCHRVVLFPAVGAYLVSFFVARALGLVGCSSFPDLCISPHLRHGCSSVRIAGPAIHVLSCAPQILAPWKKAPTFSACLGVGGSKSVGCCPSCGVFSHLSASASR